jgi:hypothetical protein
MSIFPGWGSVEATETIAHNLHITAVVVLGFLFLAEGMALTYDFRNAHLARVAIDAAETQRKSDADAAEKRHKAEVEGLQKRLAEVQKKQEPWKLPDDQKRELIAELSPFKGQRVQVVALLGDSDSYAMASDFVEVFRAANWNIQGGIGFDRVDAGNDPGFDVFISDVKGRAGVAPAGAAHLIMKMVQWGYIPQGFHNPPSPIPDDAVEVRIGARPR